MNENSYFLSRKTSSDKLYLIKVLSNNMLHHNSLNKFSWQLTETLKANYSKSVENIKNKLDNFCKSFLPNLMIRILDGE